MLFADVVFDLGQSTGWGKFLLISALAVVCVLFFVLPTLREFLSQVGQSKALPIKPITPNTAKPLKRRNVDRSSDTPPPAGFSEHLRIIEATAPNAEASVWWEYAKSEMTEAEVAIAEARLARKVPPEKPA
jgi:hypothetical protein